MNQNEARNLMIRLAELHGVMPWSIRKRPGQVLQSLPPEQREVLKQLKSEDVQNIRVDFWFEN
jgi:hypothetical protein